MKDNSSVGFNAFLKVIVSRLRKALTTDLGASLGILSFVIGGFGVWLIQNYSSNGNYPIILSMLVAITILLLWGCIGLLWIIRKESPQLVNVHGVPAVIMGILLLSFSWGMAVYLVTVLISIVGS